MLDTQMEKAAQVVLSFSISNNFEYTQDLRLVITHILLPLAIAFKADYITLILA
ncbi:hypothetical protein [Nostoc sp.]|uniref:hypothetical protein n=1 Tax=Nostoc sp. TaxID=1180 RepID=UPI002FF49628